MQKEVPLELFSVFNGADSRFLTAMRDSSIGIILQPPSGPELWSMFSINKKITEESLFQANSIF